MKMNVGKVDRIFRIILGLGGLLAGYVNNSTLWYVLGGDRRSFRVLGILPDLCSFWDWNPQVLLGPFNNSPGCK